MSIIGGLLLIALSDVLTSTSKLRLQRQLKRQEEFYKKYNFDPGLQLDLKLSFGYRSEEFKETYVAMVQAGIIEKPLALRYVDNPTREQILQHVPNGMYGKRREDAVRFEIERRGLNYFDEAKWKNTREYKRCFAPRKF